MVLCEVQKMWPSKYSTIGDQWAYNNRCTRESKCYKQAIYTKEDVSVPLDLGVSPYDSVAIEDISVEGVAKLLTDLQSHKAHDPDNIPARLLKETAHNMAPLLTLI